MIERKVRLRPASLLAGLLLATAPWVPFVAAPVFAQPTISPPRSTNAFGRPRFVIRALGFTAVNETGVDIFGSDEIVARFIANDKAMYTSNYGDVDHNEYHPFRATENCIYPAVDSDGVANQNWKCDERGGAGPITLTVDLYEFDGLLRAMLTSIDFTICAGSDVQGGRNCKVRDEVTTIGRYRTTLTEAVLVAAMPRVGMQLVKKVRVDDCSEFITFQNGLCAGHWPMSGIYDVHFQITRTANAPAQPPAHQ